MDIIDTQEQVSEAEISMVLDTYMYLDYQEAREGESLNQILTNLQDHPDYGGGGIHFGEYTILKEAALNPQIGELVVDCQSSHMGYDSGTAACCFLAPQKEAVFVAFRGTGDGEWPDNGLGMTQKATTQQNQALAYFEEAIEYLEVDSSQRLIVTGHSKGGNKAQFVTMETKYNYLLDACYSVDGQGFSETAIEGWQQKYGNDIYQERTDKIYGIYGENDYVSVLGNTIVPKEHIRYISTPVKKSNFAGYHDIKYLFATMEYSRETGEAENVFHGHMNRETMQRGVLGDYAAKLSEKIMGLPPDKRDGCAAVMMQIMESLGGSRKGINGEKMTLFDLLDFGIMGMPLIINSLIQEKEGTMLIQSAVNNDSFENVIHGGIRLQVDYQQLDKQTILLENAAEAVKGQLSIMREIKSRLSEYRNAGIIANHKIIFSLQRLEKLEEKIRQLAQANHGFVCLYQSWDEESVEMLALLDKSG